MPINLQGRSFKCATFKEEEEKLEEGEGGSG